LLQGERVLPRVDCHPRFCFSLRQAASNATVIEKAWALAHGLDIEERPVAVEA
jgi:hypothetical protein